jgi:murein tripeptide amidase MpaA
LSATLCWLCLQVELRKSLLFVVVPMLNPDGTFLGNYRCDSLGTDLNRSWASPDPLTEPTLMATKDMMQW